MRGEGSGSARGAAGLRRLVGCSRCRRQYDATGHSPGDRLRCLCGEFLAVLPARSGEAPVVRCAACGAPHAGDGSRCAYCGAPRSVADRSRRTLCPGCAARIADGARFCPACGLRIEPQPLAATATELACPACEPRRTLHSRAFPEPLSSVLECSACGGLWLDRGLFDELVRRARHEAVPARAPVPPASLAGGAVRYRDCPRCGTKMRRRNFGERSGVILDLCPAHGLWFDADELDAVLAWIRRGGLAASEDRRRREVEEHARERRVRPPEPLPGEELPASGPFDLADALAWAAETLRGLVRRH